MRIRDVEAEAIVEMGAYKEIHVPWQPDEVDLAKLAARGRDDRLQRPAPRGRRVIAA